MHFDTERHSVFGRVIGALGGATGALVVGIRMALVEMNAHKLRSMLSLLGVSLGVASLVAMLTLIGGIDVFLNEKMSEWMGTVWFSEEDPNEDQESAWSRSPGLRFSDGAYLVGESSDAAAHKKSIRDWDPVFVHGVRDRGRVEGLDQSAFEPDREHIRIAQGRWFSQKEYERGNRVAILSWDMAERIVTKMRSLGRRDTTLIGKWVRYEREKFRIVGIYEPVDPDFRPWHLRRRIAIPLRAVMTYVTGMDPDPGRLEMTVSDVDSVVEQAQRIARVLQARHRGVRDFEYRTADWLEEMSSMLGNVSLLMSIVATVSLLVGGLSIMNVMLSSVSERIYEIGIRKALGARNSWIFVQFIAETTTLSFAGGCVGIFLGMTPVLFSEPIKKATDGVIDPTVLPAHVAYVFAVLTVIGIVFGLYPAIRATRLNPTEALRYE